MKLGRWSGTVKSLRARYATYYEKFEIYVFQCTDNVAVEEGAFEQLVEFHYHGKLYHINGLSTVLRYVEVTCLPYVDAYDLFKRICIKQEKRIDDYLAQNSAPEFLKQLENSLIKLGFDKTLSRSVIWRALILRERMGFNISEPFDLNIMMKDN